MRHSGVSSQGRHLYYSTHGVVAHCPSTTISSNPHSCLKFVTRSAGQWPQKRNKTDPPDPRDAAPTALARTLYNSQMLHLPYLNLTTSHRTHDHFCILASKDYVVYNKTWQTHVSSAWVTSNKRHMTKIHRLERPLRTSRLSPWAMTPR